ncbi:MAG: hypothetical protein MJ237_06315 [bacterium]|nr:hypothetical protein [bacterium]
MLSTIGQNNNVQRFSAVNALKNGAKVTRPSSKNINSVNEAEASVEKTAPKGLLERVDVNDIRKCAEYVGEYDITDEEIKYGLMYGRSVIAEYLC